MTNEQKLAEAASLKASLIQELETANPFAEEAINSINELADTSRRIEFTDKDGQSVCVSEVVQALQLITDVRVGTVTVDVEV